MDAKAEESNSLHARITICFDILSRKFDSALKQSLAISYLDRAVLQGVL